MAGMLDRRVVLVTGGTGALGAGVLPVLVREGATVVTTAHRPGQAAPEGVEVIVADLLEPGAAEPLINRIVVQHGRIDALVCLVGGFRGGAFIQTDNQTWRELVELNVQTAVSAIRAALPGMVERDYGRIVTVGARSAVNPSPNTAAYAASKASVIAFTRSLGRELRRTGVTVNCVLPETIDTPQNRESMPKANPDNWVKPAQVGEVIAFLCSEPAGIIRGAAIPVE